MVRVHWHVEDGFGAIIPVGGLIAHGRDTDVQHAICEIELPGQGTNVEACFTLPPDYTTPGKVKDVGVVLAHGADAEQWRGALLSELAASLAQSGHLVMRYICKAKELRRQRLFEKALDVAATSPYAVAVTRWVLIGLGNGARVAAVVGGRCRGTMAGFALLSYPLLEGMPNIKGIEMGDSEPPLLKLSAPTLFITAASDELCPTHELEPLAQRMPAGDVRSVVVVDEVDADFNGSEQQPPPSAVKTIVDSIQNFVGAITVGDMEACTLPRIKSSGDGGQQAALFQVSRPGRGGAAAGSVLRPWVVPPGQPQPQQAGAPPPAAAAEGQSGQEAPSPSAAAAEPGPGSIGHEPGSQAAGGMVSGQANAIGAASSSLPQPQESHGGMAASLAAALVQEPGEPPAAKRPRTADDGAEGTA